MSGFFDRMAQRGAGVEPSLRLRPPQRFEAVPAELEAVAELPAPVPAVVVASPPPITSEAEPVVVAPAAAELSPPVGAPRAPAPAVPAETPPARVERDVAVAPPEPVVPTDVQPAPPPAAAEPPVPSPEPLPIVVEAPRAPPPPPQPPAPSPPAPGPGPRRHVAPPPEVDVVTLLREHVVPVLVERGYVRRGERPVIRERPAAAAGPPSPGTISVTPDAVAREVDEAEPQVNLNIGRIVVTRAPAPPPPSAAPPRRTVDHDAYLARREARR